MQIRGCTSIDPYLLAGIGIKDCERIGDAELHLIEQVPGTEYPWNSGTMPQPR
jgi:hypothetical protein